MEVREWIASIVNQMVMDESDFLCNEHQISGIFLRKDVKFAILD